jgi:hypothetical protein
MAGLGLACALAPRESWWLQVYVGVYLVIGFSQVYCALTSLYGLRGARFQRTPSQDAATFIQLGCWLTVPGWVLVVAALVIERWELLSDESHFSAGWQFPVGIWLIFACVSEMGALLVNLVNVAYCFQSIDGKLRLLAALNLAHEVTLGCGILGVWYLPWV